MPTTPPPDDPVAVALIEIINDPTAPEGDQLDAAMDLEQHSGPRLEQAISEILRREDFSSVLAQMCAESLAEIWAREGRIGDAFFTELRGPALREVPGILGARAPHLIPDGTRQGLTPSGRASRAQGPPAPACRSRTGTHGGPPTLEA